MADQTIVVKDSAYKASLRAVDEKYGRADAVNAAVELLHAAALGGSYNSGTASAAADAMVKGIGPLADAIQAALKGSQ